MAFPKNFICVNLVDSPFHCVSEKEKIYAKKIFLPIQKCEKYSKAIGGGGKGKFFLCVKEMPECLPKNFFKKRNRKFNGFFLLSAFNNNKILKGVNDDRLSVCCKNKNIKKWLKIFESVESLEAMYLNRKLFFICSLIMSCCMSETVFEKRCSDS
jgi:hypothetical protein